MRPLHLLILLPALSVAALPPEGEATLASSAEASPADAAGPLATYRGGEVTAEELADWRSFRESKGGASARRLDAWHLRQIALTEVLEASFLARQWSEAQRADERGWHRLLELKLAEEFLNRRIAEASTPTEAEVRRRFAETAAETARPERWILRNIFFRVPEESGADARRRARLELEALRARIEAGSEDFESAARSRSDSQTRVRGGRMGSAPLDRLAPAFARVVREMEAGDLSPIIETADGLTLLLCEGKTPARSREYGDLRPKLESELRSERTAERRRELMRRIERALEPRVELKADAPGDGAAWEASFTLNGTRRSLAPRDLEFFLSDRLERGAPASSLEAEELRRSLERRVALEGLHAEAERLGITEEPDYRWRLEWESRRMRAELERRERMPPPAESSIEASNIEAYYEQHPKKWLQRPRLRLRSIQVPINTEGSADLYRRAHQIGERVSRGELSLEGAARELGEEASLEDMGWRSDQQAWLLGLNVEEALRDLEPGKATGLVQEGPNLYIFEVLERTESRTKTLAEVRPRIVSALAKARHRRLARALNEEILSAADFSMAGEDR
ncbi:MAG: peptidyl-prolyl cis-trans isomerase [Acidobacteriota bacterium]